MSNDIFEECFKWLEDYYSSPQAPVVRDRYRKEFAGVLDELFIAAINAVSRKRGPQERFPSIDDVNKAIDEERESLWKKAKAAESKTPLSKPRPKTEHAGEAFKTIYDISDGKIKHEAAMESMEARWPGKGWKEALDRHLTEKNRRATLRNHDGDRAKTDPGAAGLDAKTTGRAGGRDAQYDCPPGDGDPGHQREPGPADHNGRRGRKC